jgi:hypothetical protein
MKLPRGFLQIPRLLSIGQSVSLDRCRIQRRLHPQTPRNVPLGKRNDLAHAPEKDSPKNRGSLRRGRLTEEDDPFQNQFC